VSLLALNALVHIPDLPNETRAVVAALPKGPSRTDQRSNQIQYVIDQIAKGLH
jgi:hypothetical protein